jgi:hypothetical protein
MKTGVAQNSMSSKSAGQFGGMRRRCAPLRRAPGASVGSACGTEDDTRQR